MIGLRDLVKSSNHGQCQDKGKQSPITIGTAEKRNGFVAGELKSLYLQVLRLITR